MKRFLRRSAFVISFILGQAGHDTKPFVVSISKLRSVTALASLNVYKVIASLRLSSLLHLIPFCLLGLNTSSSVLFLFSSSCFQKNDLFIILFLQSTHLLEYDCKSRGYQGKYFKRETCLIDPTYLLCRWL
ncbi:hypothetical protein EYC84_004909 [Monilinia fructicola]|uniref:Uncharacterized protein n=1 Tax=Monilinia fructicola TaxID=38448 RepID=A0A5M9K1Y2_MONFR|nr:hypothetical protein EYC84_004909 [Monilinia fructicola]